ncbi:MAG: hypothetical protein QOF90_2179 [Acetobacteraceae bacterium]|nr:hypothetical protein [Acetobacteraceae bacterium]
MPDTLAEAKPIDSRLLGQEVRPPALWFADEIADNDQRMSAARGVIIALLISIPFWVLVGVAIYRLI